MSTPSVTRGFIMPIRRQKNRDFGRSLDSLTHIIYKLGVTIFNLHISQLTKARKGAVADDDVIQDGNFHDMAGLGYLSRHGDIVAAGSGIAAGMVMYQDDGGSVVLNSKSKDLAGLCQCVTTLICNKRKRKIKLRTKLRK